MTLLYGIIFFTHDGIPQYKIDPRLDLDSALMDSSTSPLADWLYDSSAFTPISPEPRTPSNTSSFLSSSQSSMSSLKSYISKCERRQSQDNSHQIDTKPRLIRPPPTATQKHMRLLPPRRPAPTPCPDAPAASGTLHAEARIGCAVG